MPIYDVLVIGSGIAGQMVANRLSKTKKVAILSKGSFITSNSMLAQGGIAAVFNDTDTFQSHYEDTLLAGCGHNNEKAVSILVEKGPDLLRNLIRNGLSFDSDLNGNPLLGREGAHSHRRILHAGGDATGKAITSFLFNQNQQDNQIDWFDYTMAVELIVEDGRCRGVITRDRNGNNVPFYSSQTVLATGGCGSLYAYSSNTDTAVGDGLSLAYRAGAELVDLEFVQFHPTLLTINGKSVGLISEAVRGEGGILVNQDDLPFMEDVHPLKDLAPRDIVSREIDRRLKAGERIYLDIHNVRDFDLRFPTITALCKENGIDWMEGKIPIMPGAHFHMGGVAVDERGESSVPSLYAVGEVACTGVHGANRLASNSLLEGVVYGNAVAEAIEQLPSFLFPLNDYEGIVSSSLHRKIELPSQSTIQELLTHCVGIIRSERSLQKSLTILNNYRNIFNSKSLVFYCTETIEKIHMVTTAYLLTKSALERPESRGAHFREDFPFTEKNWTKKRISQKKITLPIKQFV